MSDQNTEKIEQKANERRPTKSLLIYLFAFFSSFVLTMLVGLFFLIPKPEVKLTNVVDYSRALFWMGLIIAVGLPIAKISGRWYDRLSNERKNKEKREVRDRLYDHEKEFLQEIETELDRLLIPFKESGQYERKV